MELKRGERARIQTEMVEFIALSFPFSSKLKIWSFHVVVVQGQERNVQKSVTQVQLLFCSLKLLLFWRSPCHRRRSFVRSLLECGHTDDVTGTFFSLFYPTSCSVLKLVARFFRIEQVKSSEKKFITSCLQEKGKTRDEKYSWRLEMASTGGNLPGCMLPCVCSVIAHRVTRYRKAGTFTLSWLSYYVPRTKLLVQSWSVLLTFEPVNEILSFDHLNETSSAVLSYDGVLQNKLWSCRYFLSTVL